MAKKTKTYRVLRNFWLAGRRFQPDQVVELSQEQTRYLLNSHIVPNDVEPAVSTSKTKK